MKSARDIVADYYLYLRERDRENLIAILAPDIVINYHARKGQLPWAGRFEGIDGFDRFFTIIREHLDIVEVNILDTMEDDGRFVNFCEGRWKYKKSGYLVTGSMVNVFSVTKGKISKYDVYADTAAFATGLDA